MTENGRDLVFPIGHYAGVRPDLGDVHQVRRGWSPETLSQDEFAVWVLAHDVASESSVAGLMRLAEDSEIAGPDRLVRALLDRGLLATASLGPTESTAKHAFAQQHRIGSLLTGFGDAETTPGVYSVGVPGTAATVALDAEAYEMWVWAPLSPTLWSFAAAQAAMLTELHGPTETADVVDDVLRTTRVLLTSTCGYLDLSVSRAHEEIADRAPA